MIQTMPIDPAIDISTQDWILHTGFIWCAHVGLVDDWIMSTLLQSSRIILLSHDDCDEGGTGAIIDECSPNNFHFINLSDEKTVRECKRNASSAMLTLGSNVTRLPCKYFNPLQHFYIVILVVFLLVTRAPCYTHHFSFGRTALQTLFIIDIGLINEQGF